MVSKWVPDIWLVHDQCSLDYYSESSSYLPDTDIYVTCVFIFILLWSDNVHRYCFFSNWFIFHIGHSFCFSCVFMDYNTGSWVFQHTTSRTWLWSQSYDDITRWNCLPGLFLVIHISSKIIIHSIKIGLLLLGWRKGGSLSPVSHPLLITYNSIIYNSKLSCPTRQGD